MANVAKAPTAKQGVKKLWSQSFGRGQKPDNLVPFRGLLVNTLLISFVFGLLTLVLRIWLPPEIPLFYGLPEGEGQLASNWLIPVPSLVSVSVVVLNTLLITLIKNDFLKRVLALSAVSIAAFSIVTTLKIFFLVASF